MAERLVAEAKGRDLEVLARLPADEAVMEFALAHQPAIRLPATPRRCARSRRYWPRWFSNKG